MNSRHAAFLRGVFAAIAVSLATGAFAAEPAEHIRTSQQFSPPAANTNTEIDAAQGRVIEARARTDGDSSALEDALIALGDAYASTRQYSGAASAYNEALQLVESQGEPESKRVLVPLLGLGTAMAESGQHQKAVPRLQRAIAIHRAQYGLFDPGQQETLKLLARSQTALDQFPDAQESLVYRAQVAEKTYGEGRPEVMLAMCDLGDWFAEIGKSLEARTTFLAAMKIGAQNGPAVVKPLQGIARTRMRAQSYPRSTLPAHEMNAVRYNSMGVILAKSKELDEEGELALYQALKILEADGSASTREALIETLVQMGDWYQIRKRPRKALPYYQRAWSQIRTARNPEASIAAALDAPVRVYFPTPNVLAPLSARSEGVHSQHILINLTVAADGSVADARIVDHDTRDRYAQDILNAIRASSFRPKFVDGEPVAVAGIEYREEFWTANTGI